jgi:hypothetical protein
VTFSGSGSTETLTGNSGGAVSPTANNINTVGTGSITIVGNPGTSTLTTELTGLTNHSILVGAGTPTITSLGVATNGQLPIGSTGADPVLANITSSGGTISITNGAGSISIDVNGSHVGETITGNSGGALSPTAGNWNIFGASTAAGTIPVTTSGSVSTLTVNVQKAQAIAATDATKVGLANFNSTDFSVDANGFVSASSTGYIRTITGTTGGAESPAAGGNFNILGGTAAAGTTPVVVAGSANTETVKVQISQAIASTDATKIGLSAFNSAQFSVDANGFVSAIAGGSGINTINGDSGSITGSTVTIYAHNSTNSTGASVSFINSGTISTFTLSDGGANVLLGQNSGNLTLSGSAPGGSGNVGVGFNTLNSLQTGNFNCALGYGSGDFYTTNESNNIMIMNQGTVADNNTIRVGTQGSGSGQQNKCFIAGIASVSVSNVNFVTINTSTGQLGSVASITPTFTWTDENTNFNAAANGNYFITGAAIATLPASPSQGNTVAFAVDTASTLTITANTGQVIRIGSAVSAAAGTAVNNARGDSVTLVYRSSDTAWIATSVIGTFTVT